MLQHHWFTRLFSWIRFHPGWLLLGWIWLIALTQARAAAGQEGPPAAQKDRAPITIDADSLSIDQRTDTVEAQGNVEIHREDMLLKADQVRVNQSTQDAEAKGNVSIDHSEGWLKGESVRFNLESEIGRIEQGEIFLDKSHLSITGRRFDKFTGQVYHVDEGFFTTCLCESGSPSWKISGREIDLQRDGEGVVKDGIFYVLDVPVFYLPYGVFPVRTERQSGFLFPKIGFSNKEGFRFQQPFFWAISRSSDATIAPHIETGARVGILGEYRQAFSRETQAETSFAYFNEDLRDPEDIGVNQNIADPDIPRDRWNFFASHRQAIAPGWQTYSDVDLYSDDIFVRELLHTVDRSQTRERILKTSRFALSRLGFLRNWEETQLQGELAYYQDFIQADRHTFHRTPQMRFRGSRFLAGNVPMEFRWHADGVSYVRDKGADGLRLDLRPEFSFPLRIAPYLFGSVAVAPRETLYYLYRTAGVFDRTNSRELVEVRGRVGTSLSRVFSLAAFDLTHLKHIVEPEMLYLFIPATRQRDIPVMDDTDRINRRNIVTFSLTNRFWGKFLREPIAPPPDQDVEVLDLAPTSELREMGKVTLALGYDIDKERKGGDTLSDLDMRFVLTPFRYLNLGLMMGLNPGPWQIRQAAGVVSIVDPRPIMRRVLDPDFMRPSQLDLTYRFIRRNFLSPLADNANLTTLPPEREIDRNAVGAFGVGLNLRVTDHLLFRFASNYDARDGRFTSNRGAIKFLSQCECWNVMVSVSRSTNPDRTRFDLQFMLLGLGASSSSSGFGSEAARGMLAQ
ncbi:MAG: LPS-assembly protein LptD [Candidatus Binatia bacterium]